MSSVVLKLQPESVKAIVNHRVNVDSNAAELQTQTVHTLMAIIKSYNLTLVDFTGKVHHRGNPTTKVTLENAYGYYTDPAPISPTDATDPDSAWTVMAGTARGMWASRAEVSEDGAIVELEEGKDLVMAPFMSTGVRLLVCDRLGLTNSEYRHEEVLGSHQAHLPVQV